MAPHFGSNTIKTGREEFVWRRNTVGPEQNLRSGSACNWVLLSQYRRVWRTHMALCACTYVFMCVKVPTYVFVCESVLTMHMCS